MGGSGQAGGWTWRLRHRPPPGPAVPAPLGTARFLREWDVRSSRRTGSPSGLSFLNKLEKQAHPVAPRASEPADPTLRVTVTPTYRALRPPWPLCSPGLRTQSADWREAAA